MSALLHLDIDALPASIAWDCPVSDDLLEKLCAANDFLTLERTKEGAIRVNPPTALFTSDGNSEITYQLRRWWKTHRRGRIADADAGFYLPDGSMLNPDGAYISPERLAACSSKLDQGFPHVCPDFVVELLSKSGSLRATQAKMEDWIANGVLLGWLIDPYKRRVLVYTPETKVQVTQRPLLAGTGPLAGFTLDLSEVWRCYE